MASHGSDTPTSPRAVLHHTEAILCTFMHTTVIKWFPIEKQTPGTKTLLSYDIYIGPIRTFSENPVG